MSPSLSSIRVVPAAGASASGVGNYRYIAHIAEGGMADVYLAVTKAAGSFEKLVVIKELRASLAEDPTFVAMFTDEARLAARLNHPNVVQTLEVGECAGRHFIAMEFLEGIPYVRLSRMRERIPPPLAFHVRVLCDVLYGLHYAHELKDFDGKPLSVVHRDVSPQNVMLTFAGGVKLLDFGIAKAALAAEQRPEDFKGKLEYMAPEQALLEDVDRRADIFSVGIMLWEAVARRRLYLKGDDKFARLVSGELPEVASVRLDAPRRLAAICGRALARDRDARYATAAEMAHEMEEWLANTTQHVASRDVGTYVEEKFEATRKKLRDAVEAQLKLFRELPENSRDGIELSRIPVTDFPPADVSEPPPPLGSSPSARPPMATLPLIEPPAGTSAPSAWTSEPPARAPALAGSAPPAPRAPSRAPYAVAAVAGLALTAAVIGLVMYARTRPPKAEAFAEPPSTSTSTGDPSEPSEIDYTIKATPADAQIFIDGKAQAGNPAKGRLRRDGAMHVLRVEAAGHEPKEEQLAFDRSFLVTLDLKPSAVVTPPDSAGAPGKVRAVHGPNPTPNSTPTPTPNPNLRGGRTAPVPRAAPNLDTENPYQ